MANTTNFGWETPDDTDLVKDGAAAMRTLGNAIDASLVDLKGGTTGQVLAKATNADLDFTWTNGGDITEVAAGTGISGGGTSGSVTITNSMATAIDAKGDLIVGTGADTFARLASSAVNNQVLTVDTSTSTGLKWAAPVAGKVLQVVQATNSTQLNTSSATYVDSNLSATITPSAASSKILIIVNQNMRTDAASGTVQGDLRIVRDSTQVYEQLRANFNRLAATGLSQVEILDNVPLTYLDSPATTSAITYKTQIKLASGTNIQVQSNSANSVITLLEIGA